jgi:ABC-type multidrug transport system fused ATPase/permease subunit
MLYDPLCKLSGAGVNLQGGAVSAARVFEVLDRDPGIADAPDARELPRQPRVLRLDNVSFEYRLGRPVLDGVSVTVAPGHMVAFVGASGVGKSTLLSLLPRFYDPTAGAILLDEVDVRRVKVRDLRQHLALVLQDNVLLPTSVAENIAYGRPGASPAEIRQAAELAGVHAFIEGLPEGYDTNIAELGQNLSGGQRQRLAIARALLTEAPVLILDEPTSALDADCERLVVETLRGLKGKRTVIVVSHRLSTVLDSDRIYVLDQGRVVEQGPHEELVAHGGLYARMARQQLWSGGPERPTPAAA